MFVVIVETHKDVEERIGRLGYLVRLEHGVGGATEKEFGLEVLNHENRRALAMLARPREVFLARRWWQVGDDEGGGEVLFTVDRHGDVIPLERNEADTLLGTGGAPVLEALGPRVAPMNVFCRPASLSGRSIPRGWL